jgi:hypothetical protein
VRPTPESLNEEWGGNALYDNLERVSEQKA